MFTALYVILTPQQVWQHHKNLTIVLRCFFSFPDEWEIYRKKKQLLRPQAPWVCIGVSKWREHPGSLTILYFFPIKKEESALPSLWKSPTTPSWKIMTKSSSSCWKHSTRGQSSSSPVKKTYGEERGTFWLHPCRSDALMTCHVERFSISEKQLLKAGYRHRF